MASIIAPARGGLDYDMDYDRVSNRGALVRSSQTMIDEPVVEHEHHHLHHHIDHGNVNSQLARPRPRNLGREYSYDDLDVRERRYVNGTTVRDIHATHDHRHRHRHRHRSGRRERMSSIERRDYGGRSDIDIRRLSRGGDFDRDYAFEDDLTVVDVPPGTRRVYVNVNNHDQSMRRDIDVDWRREHGVRRSRGLGNELWTEITKDLVTREAIEDLGYQYEETDFFYYIFEYLDREEIAELRELSEDIRHERVREIEYQSIAGSQPRMLPGGHNRDFDETRTEIIIEGNGNRRRRHKYY